MKQASITKNLFALVLLVASFATSTAQNYTGMCVSQRFYTEMTSEKNIDVRIEAGYRFDRLELSSNYRVFSPNLQEQVGFKINHKLIGWKTCLFTGIEEYLIFHGKTLNLSPIALSLQVRRYTNGRFSFSFTSEIFKQGNIRNVNYFSLSYRMF